MSEFYVDSYERDWSSDDVFEFASFLQTVLEPAENTGATMLSAPVDVSNPQLEYFVISGGMADDEQTLTVMHRSLGKMGTNPDGTAAYKFVHEDGELKTYVADSLLDWDGNEGKQQIVTEIVAESREARPDEVDRLGVQLHSAFSHRQLLLRKKEFVQQAYEHTRSMYDRIWDMHAYAENRNRPLLSRLLGRKVTKEGVMLRDAHEINKAHDRADIAKPQR